MIENVATKKIFLDDDSISRIRGAGPCSRPPHGAPPRVRREQQQRGRGRGAQVRQVRAGAGLQSESLPD